eukprot:4535983-Amphidinium_carterae.1
MSHQDPVGERPKYPKKYHPSFVISWGVGLHKPFPVLLECGNTLFTWDLLIMLALSLNVSTLQGASQVKQQSVLCCFFCGREPPRNI